MNTDSLNKEFSLKNSGWSNADDNANLARHRWYFFKEAFSPYIVEKAIEELEGKKGQLIIDPFCGSGTVPLTASLKGHKAIGFEVNPFMSFMAQTKTIHIDPQIIKEKTQDILTNALECNSSPLEKFSTFSEAGGANKWLFNEGVIRAFHGGWNATSRLKGEVKNLFELALIGAAMDTCNAVKDGKCLRYRKDWQNLNYSRQNFVKAFTTRLETMQTDLKEVPHENNNTTIITGDARQTLGQVLDDKFNLCLTSPPYLNSFDYTDVYRPELFLGGFVKSQKELMDLRLKTIRSHVQARWEIPTTDDFGPLYQDSIKNIKANTDTLWHRRIPAMVQAYFEDMSLILENLKRFAKPDASIWLVVSTSAYVGVEIPVDLIIADIGTKKGWFLREVGVLRYLRTAAQHVNKGSKTSDTTAPRLRESVIIFDAQPKQKTKKLSNKP